MTHTLTQSGCVRAHIARRPTILQRLLGIASLHRQRLDLYRLNAEQLRDVGLTREAADKEAARRPWDAPENWYS